MGLEEDLTVETMVETMVEVAPQLSPETLKQLDQTLLLPLPPPKTSSSLMLGYAFSPFPMMAYEQFCVSFIVCNCLYFPWKNWLYKSAMLSVLVGPIFYPFI